MLILSVNNEAFINHIKGNTKTYHHSCFLYIQQDKDTCSHPHTLSTGLRSYMGLECTCSNLERKF